MARATDATFGWRWIARSIMIRRFAVSLILFMTAVIYAAGLAFPISTQWAVDAIVSGQAGGELFVFALIAVLAILLEGWVTHVRVKRVTDLISFLDRRISKTHLRASDAPAHRRQGFPSRRHAQSLSRKHRRLAISA